MMLSLDLDIATFASVFFMIATFNTLVWYCTRSLNSSVNFNYDMLGNFT